MNYIESTIEKLSRGLVVRGVIVNRSRICCGNVTEKFTETFIERKFHEIFHHYLLCLAAAALAVYCMTFF